MQKEEPKTEEEIKEDNRYAYLKKQYDLATHMEKNRECDAI